MPADNSFEIQVVQSVSEIDFQSWDRLSAGRPFTSHQWYRYGEAVLTDCEPTYLIIHQHGQQIARATFWRMASDPVTVKSSFIKHGLEAFLKRWPILTCRSPLSGLSGLILPDPSLHELRKAVQLVIGAKANELLRQKGCSFLVLDYLPNEQCSGWPENFMLTSFSEPGTFMQIAWPSFEAYLEAGGKKDRQHYKRTLREAEKLGIQVSQHRHVDQIDESLSLIRGVEQRFGSPENPWARRMLENLKMVDGAIFLTANIGDRLVGCGLLLQDNRAQMNASLGLDAEVPYVYFMLVYESMKVAFDQHIQLLRMGSGAYEVKQQLGFSPEDNDSLLFTASNPVIQKAGQWLQKHL